MSNDIVKFHNDMNKISLNGFTEKELNLFFSLIFLAKEKGTRELTIPFSDLKILSNDYDRNKERFLLNLNNINKKLIALNHQKKIDGVMYTFSLFNVFGVNEEKNILTVEVNKIFSYILNDLIANYTQFELKTLISLKSSYSKNMFRLLKQWEGQKTETKTKTYSVDELRELLGVPIKYNNSKLNEKVLNPIDEELRKILPNFRFIKNKSGHKIVSYTFIWGKNNNTIDYVEDIEIQISEELERAFEKASHNRFIQPILTEDNKAELIEFFEDEKILIKGLMFAYKKIDKEFKRLSYLIKTIKTGAEQQTKTIKVVKKNKTVEDIQNDNIRQTTFDELPIEEKEDEKIDNNLSEFEKLSEKEKTQIEKKAMELFIKENGEQGNYIATMKKTSPTLYYNSLKKYIIQLISNKEINFHAKEEKKVYTIDDIPEEKLIGKNGKKLVGGALQMRIKKILKEMNKE